MNSPSCPGGNYLIGFSGQFYYATLNGTGQYYPGSTYSIPPGNYTVTFIRRCYTQGLSQSCASYDPWTGNCNYYNYYCSGGYTVPNGTTTSSTSMNLAPAPAPTAWYIDNDGDGNGSTSDVQLSCNQPPGYVNNSNDCNDDDPNLTVIGAACNDGDPNTINDVVTGSCNCEGTPAINCIADQFVNTNTAGCTYLHTTSAWNATANVTCPTSELLRTNFDVDAQGWTKKASGDASSYITHWNGSGNNHIILVEGGQGNQDWFQAPDLFLGNRAGFMGGSLTFELKTNNTTNPLTHQDHVQLVGNGLTIYATIPWPTTSFVAHSIPFGVGYWKLSGTNTMATADEILGVLSSLQAFYIRAEWRSGVEETGLNDVRFHPGILMHTLTGATTGRVGKLSNVHFNPGVTTVTALVANPCGDTYTCSFTITVTPPNTYYRDLDGDGYGDLNNDTLACATPPPGYVTNNLDCNDGSANLTIAGNTCDDGDPATTNDVVTATCTCEGILVVALEMKALLQGAMDLAGMHMRDDLRAAALLPVAHPYSGPPFNVPALITMAPALLTISDANDAVVDWVLLELRDPSDASLVLHKLPVLLQRDGDLVMADGTLPIRFAGVAPASFHIALRHRNHLGVMTATPIALGSTATLVDLTDENTGTYGTNARNISGGKAMLWSGNTNADFRLRYSGSGNDRDPIIQQIYQEHPLPVPTSVVLNVYSNNDVNLDGEVKYANEANDRDPILQNIGGTVSTATRMEQLP